MKKIFSAKEQWTNDVNNSFKKYGELPTLDGHKVEDDGIGIINDNEMYHFDEGGADDVFYLKVGDKYSKVICAASAEVLVANNYRKFPLDAAWVDIYQVMYWLHCADVDGNYEPSVEEVLHLSLYELIWMGIYSDKECIVTNYEDKEIEVDNQELIDKAIERANGELAECIETIHNCKDLQEVWELVDLETNGMSFGNDSYADKDYIGICYKSIQFDVLAMTDGGIMIAGDKVQVFDEDGNEIFAGYFEEKGVHGVKSQDECNIYLQPDEPETIKFEEEKKPKTIYEQFNDACLKHNDKLVLMAIGDFYETYDTHAEKISNILGVTLGNRNSNGGHHYLAGFPKHALDQYLSKLIRKGYKVAIENGNGETNIYPTEKPETQKEDEIDIDAFFPFDEDGEHVFHLSSQFWLSIEVQKSWDMFSWVLYDQDFKMIDRDYRFGLDKESWYELFSPTDMGFGEHTGVVESITSIAPSIFYHLKNAK